MHNMRKIVPFNKLNFSRTTVFEIPKQLLKDIQLPKIKLPDISNAKLRYNEINAQLEKKIKDINESEIAKVAKDLNKNTSEAMRFINATADAVKNAPSLLSPELGKMWANGYTTLKAITNIVNSGLVLTTLSDSENYDAIMNKMKEISGKLSEVATADFKIKIIEDLLNEEITFNVMENKIVEEKEKEDKIKQLVEDIVAYNNGMNINDAVSKIKDCLDKIGTNTEMPHIDGGRKKRIKSKRIKSKRIKSKRIKSKRIK